jgi:hypothetical protein
MAAVQPEPWLRALITTTTTNNNNNVPQQFSSLFFVQVYVNFAF